MESEPEERDAVDCPMDDEMHEAMGISEQLGRGGYSQKK